MAKHKLLLKLKNAPTDTSQVCSTVSSGLNREETLSVQDIELDNNNSDENRLSGKRERNLRVFVLNMRGEPIMPTIPAKAKHLLDDNKAEVVQRKPFTIQLKYPTGETKQKITLGIDSGYSKVGFSAVTDTEEIISGELTLRNDISKKLEQRRNYRRTRRSRKWYREPRFDNREREEGWIAPSLRQKADTHKRLVNKLKIWMPVTKTIIEVAKFDTQKMRNPEIEGIEYQQGELQGYNVRNYLLEKFDYQCVYCGKKDTRLEVEHIIPKSRKGGTNRVDNLTISCHDCNQEKGDQTAEEFGFPEIQKQAKQTLKQTPFMNIVRKKIAEELDCDITFGHITKKKRFDYGLHKSHINDAFLIAGGIDQIRCRPYEVIQNRRNNRKLQLNRKGFGRSVRRERYRFQPKDLVEYQGKEYRVKGTHCKGKRVVLEDVGSKSIKDIELICYGKGLIFENMEVQESKEGKGKAIPLPPEGRSLLAKLR